MKYAFGAAPMPTVNSRPSPICCTIIATSSASLLTLPSVMNTICRRLSRIGGHRERQVERGLHFGAAIGMQTVDEARRLRLRRGVHRLHLRIQTRGIVAEADDVEACRPLDSRATPSRSAARACSIEGPSIEPEVSMMNSTSRL